MIFYFTGTGNSLQVARNIAEQQKEKLVSIATLMNSKAIAGISDWRVQRAPKHATCPSRVKPGDTLTIGCKVNGMKGI